MLRKYQNGGQEEISEKQYFANYLKEAEGTDAVMKKTKSLVLKPDGKTYYKALENGIYYPYNDLKGNATIGYGRHNSTILADYPNGISADKANEFLLEDIDNNFNLAKRQFNNEHGAGQWDNLTEREQYMVTNHTYNPGSIYKIFSGALLNKDTKVAGNEYKIYTYTNKGKENETKRELGRNKLFYDAYLKDWIYNTDNPPVEEPVEEEPVESTKETPKKGPYSSVGKTGWFGLPDMGITEALFGFQRGGQRQMGGAMMSNPSMYQRMQQLPGGIMQQIPGSDAVEFKGQTHKQGGILMDAETEVEDGETMDKVVMKDGEAKDYFFSSYLKKQGRSYADMHKEILSRGGDQKEINYLAAMQEKAAKRKPGDIAKLGGVASYATGGFDETDPSKKEIKAFQKEKYKYYNGPLSFRKWNKQNPFNLDEYMAYMNPEDPQDAIPEETIGLRQDLPGAYNYRADAGDGYTICQSGNCQDGIGVMYTYYAENTEEWDALLAKNPDTTPYKTPDGTVIAMYEGEFKDGKPVGQGKFTWNDIDQSLSDGVAFVPWKYSSTGEFKVDNTGHPELVSGTKDWGDLGTSSGIFTDNKLTSGTLVKNGKTTNYEEGKEVKKFSKEVKNNLTDLGILEKVPFKYSQGDINPVYSKMKDHGSYTQPTETELNALGYSSHDEFRADYERLIDASYDWKNVTDWGKQHEDALGEIRKAVENKSFVPTGTFNPSALVTTGTTGTTGGETPLTYEEAMATVGLRTGPQVPCPCAPEYSNYNVPEGVDCFGCENDIVGGGDKGKKGRKGWFGFDDKTVPGLALASGAAQMIPAAYAFLHDQPNPDMVPFESGVTSPIVPGRLRAKKLSHINMNKQRSANDARLREMNQFIDTSGGGPASMANRMAAWGKKHEGDMQIAAQEKQANIGIENQNVAIENQTNLHNLKMEQEAALGNAQMQMSEAQRLNEVNAINTAAKNKIKDDEEYMKYAGIIAASQGVGSIFGDMLAYKGDMYRAQGYDIEGTTQRMLLRRHLGRTLMVPGTRTPFCQECTQEDIANYYNTYYPKQQSTIQ